jgi:hypothetical protein
MRLGTILLFHKDRAPAMEFHRRLFGGRLDVKFNRDGLVDG